MLGEGFLRVLRYREERKLASKSKDREKQNVDKVCSDLETTGTQEGQASLAQIGPPQVDPLPNQDTSGLLIPGCQLYPSPDPVLVDLDDCSLLVHYPDLQVADSGRLPLTNPKTTTTPPQLQMSPAITVPNQLDPEPDQGYLVMSGSVNISMEIPGLEPMSNSVLNGMLEKKLDEVYMQHLTENLARCNSNFGNSLLHGLVPPPMQNRGVESLVDSMEERSTSSEKTISYLNTNTAPCSSNFSSPVLRISEGGNQD